MHREDHRWRALRVVLDLFWFVSPLLVSVPVVGQEAAARYLRLTVDEVVERELAEGAKSQAEATSEATFSVTFGPRWIGIVRDGGAVVLDYERGRERRVDVGAATYTEVSLLARFAFAQAESVNRTRQAKMLDAAGLSRPEFEPFELSVLFGWPAEGDRFDAQRMAAGDRVQFAKGDDVITAWKPSEHELSTQQRAMMDRFLQREAHLHPEVRAAIVDGGKVPAELVFRWHDVGVQSRAKWTITKVEPLLERGLDTAEMKRTFAGDGLGKLERFLHDDDAEDRPERLDEEQYLKRAAAAADADRPEDAVLLLLEAGFVTGQQYEQQMRAMMQKEGARDRVAVVMRGIGSANNRPKQALEVLAEVDDQLLSRPRILDVFRANATNALGKPDEACALMLKALTSSPWMAMAYMDLGDMFYRRFDTHSCWRAWDLGRKIAPKHPCWRNVNAYEQRLRKEFRDLL